MNKLMLNIDKEILVPIMCLQGARIFENLGTENKIEKSPPFFQPKITFINAA